MGLKVWSTKYVDNNELRVFSVKKLHIMWTILLFYYRFCSKILFLNAEVCFFPSIISINVCQQKQMSTVFTLTFFLKLTLVDGHCVMSVMSKCDSLFLVRSVSVFYHQVSLINFVASLCGAGGIQAFKTMRTLRALRPLRAMSRMQGMRVGTPPCPWHLFSRFQLVVFFSF